MWVIIVGLTPNTDYLPVYGICITQHLYRLMRELLQIQLELYIFSLHALLLWDSLVQILWCNECLKIALPHSSLSLLGEGCLKDQSCCLNLRKNLKGNPGWWQFWNGGVYGRCKVLDMAWPFLAVFPVQCVVGVAGIRAAPIHGIVAYVMSAGEVVSVWMGAAMPVGCLMAQVVMEVSISQRAVPAGTVAGWGAWCVPSETVASVMVGMTAGLWSGEMSPMSGSIIGGVWSAPLVWFCWCLVWDLSWWSGFCEGGILLGQSSAKWQNSSQP